MGLLPDNYKPAKEIKKEQFQKDPRYLEPSSLEEGASMTFRPCGTHSSGHVIAGYQYFSETLKRTRRFPTFPDNYLEDIGLSYEGRVKGTGEKGRPEYFLSLCCLSRESGDFAILTLPRVRLREQVEAIFSMPDYQVEDGDIASFYVTISKQGKGKDAVYSAIPTLKPPTAAERKRWQEVKNSIWLPALYASADPWAGKPAEAAVAGMPPTARDELGADEEVAAGAVGAW